MGSRSDLEVMREAVDTMKEFEVPFEVTVVSAHRTPEKMVAYARGAAARPGKDCRKRRSCQTGPVRNRPLEGPDCRPPIVVCRLSRPAARRVASRRTATAPPTRVRHPLDRLSKQNEHHNRQRSRQ